MILRTTSNVGESIKMEIDPQQVKRIMRMYDTLGKKLVNKIIKRETRPFSKKITEAAKANAPVKTGKLRKSIKTRVVKNSKGSKLRIIGTATQTGDGFFKGDTYYGGFQEFGWHIGRRTKEIKAMYKIDNTGSFDTRPFIEGKHYMKKAVDSHGKTALRGAANAIAKALDDEAKQLSRTGGGNG